MRNRVRRVGRMVGSWLTLWLLVANVAAAAQGGRITRDEALAAVIEDLDRSVSRDAWRGFTRAREHPHV